MGCADLVTHDELALLYKRYERAGEFNQLVFLRDMDRMERMSWQSLSLNYEVQG